VSKLAGAILTILDREGYISGFSQEGEGVHQAFRIGLKYGPRRVRTITGLRRVSTPGRRVYRGRGELPRVMGGLGIAIVSTSRGVMTDKEASRAGIGGEVLAYVW
jgi:small subunit ribosomal protein S8